MKTTGTLILGILVVLCFGLLWALNGPAKSAPISQDQQFTGKENHQIDLVAALKLMKNYESDPKAPAIKGGYFGRAAIEKVLAQPGCVGIRYYYARNDDGTPTIVIFGVDAKGFDIQTGIILDIIIPCPPFCGQPH
jgi:hypothetical protein